MREFGILHVSYWSWARNNGLTPEETSLGAYFLSNRHGNSLGCYCLPPAYAADDLGYDIDKVSIGYQKFEELGFIRFCPQSRFVLILKYLKWSKIKNKKHALGAIKAAEVEIPSNFTLLKSLIESLEEYSGPYLEEADIQRLRNTLSDRISDTLSIPYGIGYRYTETETETETKTDHQPSADDRASGKSKNPGSKHIADRVNESDFSTIKSLCEKLEKKTNGKKTFNPWQWVQAKVKKEPFFHPQALIDALEGLLAYWHKARNPWSYADTIFMAKNLNYNEAECVAEHREFVKAMSVFEKTPEGQKLTALLDGAIKGMDDI